MLKNKIQVINFDARPKLKRFVDMFPDVMRAGIFGPSGGGKTNILLTILLHVKPFQDIYLCSKTDFQEKYELLQELIENYKPIKFHKLSFPLPEPETLKKNSIVIFDDVLTENQNEIANYFLRGRHCNISCFYLSQAYTKIVKSSGIRTNFNYLIILKSDIINLRQIHLEYVTDLSFEKFKQLCNDCWGEPYGFLVIDVDNEQCRYKKNFEKCL
jgi:hypothetical protein